MSDASRETNWATLVRAVVLMSDASRETNWATLVRAVFS